MVADGLGISAEFQATLSSVVFADIRVALHTGSFADARALTGRAFGDMQPDGLMLPFGRIAGAELAVAASLPDASDLLADAASTVEENDWAEACLLRATGRLHDDPDALAAAVERWERIGARFERACTLLLLPDRLDAGGRGRLRRVLLRHGPGE
ncbi:hypothetical protein [Nonomuraea sp. LPB2021202275-12-8]|uniref:hypothetical protein n=1 Tax=Nonomuraea sp. LPB2021202275-12-8 TaxID=3120159 RepID=UPI00300C1BD8